MAADKEASFLMRLIDMVSGPATKISAVVTTTTDKITKLTGSVGGVAGKAFAFNQLHQAIGGVGDVLDQAVAPGIRFDSAIGELKSVTGLAQDKIDALSESARKQAQVFGGDAADALDSYNMVINRLGPQVAVNAEAMASMGNDVARLSKLMKGDAKGAAEALSTSMLQYNVNLKDPIETARKMTEYTDIMAAGMNAGSMDVTKVSAALEQAGSTSRKAGLSFAETNAAIQTMAKSGKMGSEAGVGLRNVLAKLAGEDVIDKKAREKLHALHVDMKLVSDTTRPFADRLRELKKLQGDATATVQVFGVENKVAADTLLDNIDYYSELIPQITGTTAATDAAIPIMDTFAERMSRKVARVKDFGISLFNATREYLPFIQATVTGLDTASRLGPAYEFAKAGVLGLVSTFRTAEDGTKGLGLRLLTTGWSALKMGGMFIFSGVTAVGSLIAGLVSATAAQLGLNVAMYANPVGLFIVGLLAIGAAIATVITYWDDLKGYMVALGEFLWEIHPFHFLIDLIDNIFPGFKAALGEMFDSIIRWFGKMWDKVASVWKWVKGLFGKDTISIPTFNFDAMGGGKGDKNKSGDSASSQLGKQNKGADIEGDKSKARIVNTRIDKLEVNVKVDGERETRDLRDLGRKVAEVIVGSIRDSEIILSNG